MHKKASDYMIQNLEEIEYRTCMLEKGMKPNDLPVTISRAAMIPVAVRDTVHEGSRSIATSAFSNGAQHGFGRRDFLRIALLKGEEFAGLTVEYIVQEHYKRTNYRDQNRAPCSWTEIASL